jgi:hypothetical protein
VWVHGDVAASDLLLAGGALHAVIDFGCAAVGDPACDLVMAWTFFPGQAAAVFRRGLPFDEATWARARGWALWKALVTLSRGTQRGGSGRAAVRRFGWRYGPPPDHRPRHRRRRPAGRALTPPPSATPGTAMARPSAVAGLRRLLAQICWQTSARNSTSALSLKRSHPRSAAYPWLRSDGNGQ